MYRMIIYSVKWVKVCEPSYLCLFCLGGSFAHCALLRIREEYLEHMEFRQPLETGDLPSFICLQLDKVVAKYSISCKFQLRLTCLRRT